MRRSTHLTKRAGLGQSSREVRVGTFGSRSIPQGESRSYTFTVEEGGSIEKLDEAAGVTIDGNTVKGKVWGPGGFDNFRVTGQIVSANLPQELVFQDAQVAQQSGGGNGGNGSSGGGTAKRRWLTSKSGEDLSRLRSIIKRAGGTVIKTESGKVLASLTDSQLQSVLSVQGIIETQAPSGGGGSGNGSTGNGGNGSGGGGNGGGGKTTTQQAGVSTTTLLVGGGVAAAVVVGAVAMSGN